MMGESAASKPSNAKHHESKGGASFQLSLAKRFIGLSRAAPRVINWALRSRSLDLIRERRFVDDVCCSFGGCSVFET
jgi:hypothetical protein